MANVDPDAQGVTVVCSIHQPSYEVDGWLSDRVHSLLISEFHMREQIFQLIDYLVLLSCGRVGVQFGHQSLTAHNMDFCSVLRASRTRAVLYG